MVSAGGSFWALLGQLHQIAWPVLTLVYPVHQSILAIESLGKEDDAQWLTYWVIFYSFVELGFERLLSWIPFWYELKLVAVAWLVLPPFRGAAFIYDNYVRRYAGTLTTVKIHTQLNTQQRSILNQMSPEARLTVAAYINENGTEAFDRVVRSAEHEFKRSSPSGTGDSKRHWWSSDKRSPESKRDRSEKKQHFWSGYFSHSDEHHSDRKYGGWSPSRANNWGWDTHFDGGMSRKAEQLMRIRGRRAFKEEQKLELVRQNGGLSTKEDRLRAIKVK
ncbi:hypothetical protein R1sor_006948 [Riccia sorocarpa]|uniref:HVA22-like protein n=1 Tax=Riccia sorocarpa TaxID=122646 RepID=A0ABD3HSJ1_9MARC